MKLKFPLPLLAALVLVFGSGYAVGKQRSFAAEMAKVEADYGKADNDLISGGIEPEEVRKRAPVIEGQIYLAVADDFRTRALTNETLRLWKSGAPSYAAFKLSLLQVKQNQRIIELLEKQAIK